MKCIGTFGFVALSLTLAACSAKQASPPPPLTLVTKAVPPPEPEPAPLTGAQLLAQQPQEVQEAVKQHQQDDAWQVYKTPRRELYPCDEGQEPAVDCAPLRTTDIQLEPGETITDVASGDSQRWLVTPASSGDPRNPTPHLAIKPTAAGISTNLTIYTTKHIYHLMLRSRAGHEIQEVAFYYPEDLEEAMQDADHTAAKAHDPQSPDGVVASLASLDPGALNFSYTVSGPKAAAEFGAAFLCAEAGISNAVICNQAGYVAGWLKKLRDDRKLLIHAAAQAQRAAGYILNRTACSE